MHICITSCNVHGDNVVLVYLSRLVCKYIFLFEGIMFLCSFTTSSQLVVTVTQGIMIFVY
jgi:hypothetical protein